MRSNWQSKVNGIILAYWHRYSVLFEAKPVDNDEICSSDRMMSNPNPNPRIS